MHRLLIPSLVLLTLPACAQQPAAPAPAVTDSGPGGGEGQPAVVSVGKGSYASFVPPSEAAGVAKALPKAIYIAPEAKDLPIPTNHWWTNMIFAPYMGQMWSFPQQVRANPDGLELTFPTKWQNGGNDLVSDEPIKIGAADFHPVDSRALHWSDWLVTSRLFESPNKYWDVTMGRGLPYTWIEPHGVNPELKVDNDAKFFGVDGKDEDLAAAKGAFGLEFGDRSYGVFTPAGTTFSFNNGLLQMQPTAANPFLIICPLPNRAAFAAFSKYGYAIPREGHFSWSYDAAAGLVRTHWHLETQPLQGAEKRLIQGWLPHHYRTTKNDLQMAGLEYQTPRGLMKCAVGTDFNLTYAFNGIPPVIPAPQKLGLPHDYDSARMHDFVQQYATRTKYGDDTYWGGKSVLQLAQYMLIAKEIGDPAFTTLHDTLKTALTDWFTYTPGETAHYFAAYPRYKALVGFKTSYGSESFNDQHFHYGYLITASAMLGMVDPQFLRDYGPMARLVAKEYANWDHADPSFPFLRTFDVWEGHSWAGGTSGATGDNQESSSEAAQSWGGLFLLGQAMGDKDMAACGAMGYTTETRAIQEYWFNRYGDNFPPQWQHKITGMVWSGGKVYGTYFSGDPAWIWGIQWLPTSPILGYLVEDPAFAKQDFNDMWVAKKEKDGPIDLDKFGVGLGNVILSQAAQVNPDWAVDQFETLWTNNSKVAHDNDTPGLTYYLAHSNQRLGLIQWNYTLSEPLSRVYHSDRGNTTLYTAFNPGAAPEEVKVTRDGKAVGHFTAAPGQLTEVTALTP